MEQETILVVDDHREIVYSISELLKYENYRVLGAYNGKEALEVLEREPVDLVLLDVMMPGIDGFSLLEKLREDMDCPVLFLTAKTSEEDVMKGFGLGADDYIRKPFGIGELRARVQAHIRRERRERTHAVIAGDVRFYLREKRAVYRERELPFTKSEYEICEYLALHRGQVFSREQIYEHVFGYDGESDSSAITEHIKNIRAKCREAGCEPVETVWGMGYKWRN